MTYLRIKPDVNLEAMVVSMNNTQISASDLVQYQRLQTFLQYHYSLDSDEPLALLIAIANNRSVRTALPKEYLYEVYKGYTFTLNNERHEMIDINHDVGRYSSTFYIKGEAFPGNRLQLREFSHDRYENYIPTMQTFRFKTLREIDLKTNIPVDKEYMLESTYTTVIDKATMYNKTIEIDDHTVYCSDLEEAPADMEDTRPPAIIWSTPRSRTIDYTNDYLKDQLRVRYAMFNRPLNGLSNIVLDSFVPRLMYLSNMNLDMMKSLITIPKTAVTISPWFAHILGIKCMEIEQLCRIIGYDKKTIKTLFAKVRAKNLTLNMVGFGGTSINTIHWLHEMSKMTHSINLFKQIKIWEPDTIEISNLLRFPINAIANPKTYYKTRRANGITKLDLLNGELERLSRINHELKNSYFNAGSYDTPYRKDSYDSDREIVLTDPKEIIYGAPDIATRELLSPLGNFISATHSDASCRIDLNPAQNCTLQEESYGVISLSAFFMNQLRMAIGLLELLASDQDLQEQDKTVLEYTFNGVRKLPTDREYNFQLAHSGLVLTQEEANANV